MTTCGWLKKHRKISGDWRELAQKDLTNNWKLRYFVLHKTSLKYFENDTIKIPKGTLDVTNAEAEPAKELTGVEYSFGIFFPASKCSLIAIAQNKEDYTLWIESVTTSSYMARLSSNHSCTQLHL
eukprot:c17238_g1_i1.p1 GENE.c17238_g1_i1~~c17238_g1_i1.p1  ORF type:complete len:125 (+),score=23.10 c17238_g1_i1:208-582(+)